uniref:Uncharacterized protein n=1 Tax=Arundo donax TaxID=35708 RepID=A0A0A9GV85_ARUDO
MLPEDQFPEGGAIRTVDFARSE